MFCNYQINLENTTIAPKGGGDIQYFWEEGRTLYEGTWNFIGGLDNHLESMLYYLTLIIL